MRYLTAILLLLVVVLAGPLRSQESSQPTVSAEEDAVERLPGTNTGQDAGADAESERPGSRDGFLPTERLRHDQEVDYPTDI